MKKIILSILALLMILVLLSLGIYNFVDISDYKDNITSLVKTKTGKDIIINGDVRLRILPDIALDISDVDMKSPAGSDSGLVVSSSNVILHLRFLPLFKKDFEISSLKLIKPLINITIFEDGSNNLTVASNASTDAVEGEKQLLNFNYTSQRDFINNHVVGMVRLDKIIIEDAKINLSDKRKSLFMRIDNFNVATSLITPEYNLLKISGKLKEKDTIDADFNLDGKYQLSKDFYELSGLTIKLGGIVAHGEASVDFRSSLPDLKVAFYFEDMNLNPYISLIDILFSNKNVEEKPVARNFMWDEKPIDFGVLRTFNGHFSFKSNNILYKDVDIGSVTLNSYLRNGKFTLSVKEAEILGGNINGESVIDVTSNIPKIRKKINLEEVDFTKSPFNLGAINNISGKVSGGIILASRGISQKEFIKNLNGIISLRADDGVLKNIDLFAMAKNIPSAFNIGKNPDYTSPFKEVAGDFGVSAGIITTDDFTYLSEQIDFNGKGGVNLPELTVNFKMVPKIKRIKNESDSFSAIRMPLLISGNLLQPSFKLEPQSLVEDVIKNPKGTETLVNQLKNDFDSIKDTMKSDAANGNDDVVKDLKNILNGF